MMVVGHTNVGVADVQLDFVIKYQIARMIVRNVFGFPSFIFFFNLSMFYIYYPSGIIKIFNEVYFDEYMYEKINIVIFILINYGYINAYKKNTYK